MHCVDALNQRFGRGTVRPAATAVTVTGQTALWQGKAQWKTQAYTTQLEGLLMVG